MTNSISSSDLILCKNDITSRLQKFFICIKDLLNRMRMILSKLNLVKLFTIRSNTINLSSRRKKSYVIARVSILYNTCNLCSNCSSSFSKSNHNDVKRICRVLFTEVNLISKVCKHINRFTGMNRNVFRLQFIQNQIRTFLIAISLRNTDYITCRKA